MFLLIISTSLFKFRHLIKMRNFSSSPIFVSKVSNLLFEALSFQILLSVALNTFRTSHINHEDLMYRGHNKTFTFSLSRLNFNYLSNILNKGSFSLREENRQWTISSPVQQMISYIWIKIRPVTKQKQERSIPSLLPIWKISNNCRTFMINSLQSTGNTTYVFFSTCVECV